MHLLLGLSSLALFFGGSFLALRLLRYQRAWEQRRWVQCLVLALPLSSLLLGLAGLHHFAGQPCLSNAPWWDARIELLIPLTMGVITLGATGLGVSRLLLMQRVMVRTSIPAGSDLQTRVDALAERLHAPRTRVRLCAYNRPLALTAGVLRPTILLSTWMLTHLDRGELEGVLAHELEHAARRDYPLMWLATLLRDAFFYVPTSWTAYRLLQQEKELACDELAAETTHRPLALASALTKVWLHAGDQPETALLASVPHLVRAGEPIHERIERLLAPAQPAEPAPSTLDTRTPKRTGRRWEIPALVGLMLLEIGNIILMLGFMGCGPASLFGKVF